MRVSAEVVHALASFFFFLAEDGIRDPLVTGVQTCALPIFYILAPMLYRKDLFDASNLKYPDTWELARVAARTLKPKGHPTGIALSQCADANLFWRSMFFS